MRRTPVIRRFGHNRLHLQDGPIDLIAEAFGAAEEIEIAYRAAGARFITILDELCAELPLLRSAGAARPVGIVAQRMWDAVAPFASAQFITPMAAVAGAVAEEVLGAMTNAGSLQRAYVNNGGDIAVFLAKGETLRIGMVDRPDYPSMFGSLFLASDQPVRGIATSGWRGRSFSLGIADAVTVLADTAAMADAAATIIANAVDLPGHAAIERRAAQDLAPDNDLGARPVTVAVGTLTEAEKAAALERGCRAAEMCLDRQLIRAVALHLGGQTRQVEGALQIAAA
ncbi:UPF0280 family protein [Dongia sp.]|uniref:UPF0280 family protein n=1 Tax=Dongia sp. TaxID=1977262 RepID=UPI003753DC4D